MQQKRDLAKTTAALNIAALGIEGAAGGDALAANTMREDISAAPHNSNSPQPRATAAILVYNINIYSLYIFNFQREDSPVKAHQQQLLYREIKP